MSLSLSSSSTSSSSSAANSTALPNHDNTTPSRRMLPNILISGTPGTGKSSLCEQLAVSVIFYSI